ncbi:hypothetical protein L1987_75432 [Smallanthus sonchifolius]|uniref:Uncharacterized protein n=1 Tax=Smallanthus sonchifolius TaxID=185202 RepID=A0ACB9A761_9ASTR|nr:hypothetical protein L1987_75432 [Smallanthus sonchifolius]
MGCLNMILFFILTESISAATDAIFPNQTLKDGDTLVSAGEIFELGFFSFENSSIRYLGIWYKNISPRTFVWVANRKFPLLDASSVLKLNDEGSLQLLSVNNTQVWTSSSKLATNSNSMAQLLDSGNLVIRDDIGNDFIWQSFDHPGDTWLPGMKIGVDHVTRKNWNLTSWKTSDDPSLGSFTVCMNTSGYPQLYNMKYESSFQQRIGYWNGLGFSGMLGLGPSNFYTFEFVLNGEETYCRYKLKNTSYITRMTLNHQGIFEQLVWNNKIWDYNTRIFKDQCDQYGLCGPYGICNINKTRPPCACLKGFEPKLPEEWSVAKWSNGCKRQIHLTPEKGNTFFMNFSDLKMPDSQNSRFNSSISLEECKNLCANNVSCTAFANSDIRGGGSGCLMWSGELMDIREAPPGDNSGQDIYIKMANHTGNSGYISPEYATNGLFSLKSDVFSFGVLVLEIVSGKKNRGFSHQNHHDNLLGHAWRLYKEAKPLELVDVALGDSWDASEVLQSIHVDDLIAVYFIELDYVSVGAMSGYKLQLESYQDCEIAVECDDSDIPYHLHKFLPFSPSRPTTLKFEGNVEVMVYDFGEFNAMSNQLADVYEFQFIKRRLEFVEGEGFMSVDEKDVGGGGRVGGFVSDR